MRYLLLLTSIVLFAFGCKKDTTNIAYNGIPNVPVNATLYLNNPSYNILNVVGGSLYLQGGSRGIIIYRASTEYFTALERHCTYQSSDACAKVNIDSTTFINAVCTCCHSKYILTSGAVTEAPATVGLKNYICDFDAANNILTIRN